jgi:hypothetical protein
MVTVRRVLTRMSAPPQPTISGSSKKYFANKPARSSDAHCPLFAAIA